MRLLLVLLMFLVGCQEAITTKEVDLYNTSGDMNGTATFSETKDGVKIKIAVEGLEPGFHGIHIHEYPLCEGPEFKSAGNHLNPEGKEHGLMHPEGAHLGDLPNIEADLEGLVEAELLLSDATLKEGKTTILHGEGTSLIITDEKDDGISQPAGDSGKRIICGVLKLDDTKKERKEPTDPTEDKQKESEE